MMGIIMTTIPPPRFPLIDKRFYVLSPIPDYMTIIKGVYNTYSRIYSPGYIINCNCDVMTHSTGQKYIFVLNEWQNTEQSEPPIYEYKPQYYFLELDNKSASDITRNDVQETILPISDIRQYYTVKSLYYDPLDLVYDAPHKRYIIYMTPFMCSYMKSVISQTRLNVEMVSSILNCTSNQTFPGASQLMVRTLYNELLNDSFQAKFYKNSQVDKYVMFLKIPCASNIKYILIYDDTWAPITQEKYDGFTVWFNEIEHNHIYTINIPKIYAYIILDNFDISRERLENVL